MTTKTWCTVCLFLASVIGLFLILPNRGSAHASEATEDHVQIAMKNVMYHYTGPIAVHVVQLQGEILPTKSGDIPVFDDKNSFILALNSAEIAISCDALARVLNQNVLSASNAPIKDLSIESKNNQLVIKGKLPQKGDVSFETTGVLKVEGDGRIRLHTEHLKAAHLPVKGLLDLLGMDIARMIDTKKIQGISADKDDLILNPEEILPPPHIQGRVTAVRVQGNDIVQVFGKAQGETFAAKQTGNYLAFRHGDLRFGKLTMRDSDLIMIDMDPRDPFDFYLDHYQDQLVAGYTKSTPAFGLRAYARDYDKLPHRSMANQRKR
ncbi:MAG: hypothetical protein WBW36_05240 [Candidatus Sulfotelmatobacter sp.]